MNRLIAARNSTLNNLHLINGIPLLWLNTVISERLFVLPPICEDVSASGESVTKVINLSARCEAPNWPVAYWGYICSASISLHFWSVTDDCCHLKSPDGERKSSWFDTSYILEHKFKVEIEYTYFVRTVNSAPHRMFLLVWRVL